MDASTADSAAPDAAALDASSGSDAGSNGSDAGLAEDAGNAAGSCPVGATLLRYSLSPVDPLPDLSMIELPNLLPSAILQSAGDGTQFSARFDVCDDAGERRLTSVLIVDGPFETPTLYRYDDTISARVEAVVELEEGLVVEQRLPPGDFLVEGLDAALQGDLRELRIRLVGEYGLLIRGHEGFLASARGNVGPSSIVYNTIYVVIGGLVEGDVFAGLECDFGEQTLTQTFTMSTATFDVEACTFLGGGETTGYRISSLAVQDTSAELSPAEQQRFEFNGEAEVESVMNYVFNHHNACDSFHLALPHADYAATSSPLAGCGTSVPNAPSRSFDEDPILPVLFRIRYHGGAWVDGSIAGCNHYLFCD